MKLIVIIVSVLLLYFFINLYFWYKNSEGTSYLYDEEFEDPLKVNRLNF